MTTTRQYRDTQVDVKLVLCALWATTLFVFAHVDIFGFYRADVLDAALAGTMASTPFTVDQLFLTTTLVYLLPAILMIVGSLVLPPASQPDHQHRRQRPVRGQHHRVLRRRDLGLLPARQPRRGGAPRRRRLVRLEMAGGVSRQTQCARCAATVSRAHRVMVSPSSSVG